MKRIVFSLISFLSLFSLSSCYTNVFGEGEGGNGTSDKFEFSTIKVRGSIVADSLDTDGLAIVALIDSQAVDKKDFEVTTIQHTAPQFLIVSEGDDKAVMLYRDIISEDNDVVIDVQSTALALATMHPLLCGITEYYPQLKEFIKTSDYYQPYYDEVAKSIQQRGDIFDPNNTSLLIALSDLLDDLCEDPSDYIQTTRAAVATRAGLNVNAYPVKLQANRNTLTMSVAGVAPSYYGTVKSPSGTTDLALETALNYGGMDLLKAGFNWLINEPVKEHDGEPVDYTFKEQGNHRFSLSRTGFRGQLDFYRHMVHTLLNLIGLPIKDQDLLKITYESAQTFMAQIAKIDEPGVEDYLLIAGECFFDMAGEYLSVLSDEFSKGFAPYLKFVGKSFNLYGKMTNGVNAAARVALWVDAPEKIEFCLCCYDNKIQSCMEAELEYVGGDNQEGEAKQALLEPLRVKVKAYDEQGNVMNHVFLNVKFKVTSGGGSMSQTLVGTDDEAKVTWTLGDGQPGEVQTAEAVIVDRATGEEICEPVKFTAVVKKSSAITVRLDWHKLSGDTDIDLHVVDPYGEEIYYAHSRSRSGGWLDRDDTKGPGPEHIYWSDAPAGTYKVAVHYYDSDSKAVTSYRVTTSVNGETRTFSGSIAYHKMVSVTSFTIPGTRSAAPVFVPCDWQPEIVKYPAKPKR